MHHYAIYCRCRWGNGDASSTLKEKSAYLLYPELLVGQLGHGLHHFHVVWPCAGHHISITSMHHVHMNNVNPHQDVRFQSPARPDKVPSHVGMYIKSARWHPKATSWVALYDVIMAQPHTADMGLHGVQVYRQGLVVVGVAVWL
jgi:hypothetical protein